MKKFIKTILVFSLPLGLILIILIILNPYNHPDLPLIDSITELKENNSYIKDERLSLAVHCLGSKRNIMFFGDSRTEQFFGRFSYVNELVENRAFGGAVFNEILEIAWHSLLNADSLDHIIIGISFNHYSDYQIPLMQSAISSSNNILKCITNKHQIKSSVSLLRSLVTEGDSTINPLEDPEFKETFWNHQLDVLARQFYENMEPNEAFYNELTRLISYCYSNNIKVTLFSPPTHTDLQNLIGVYELDDMYKEFISLMNSFECEYINYDVSNSFNENRANFNDPFHLSPSTRQSFYNSIKTDLLK